MKGNIHSIETLGLHDGPGIRTVIFFQGCKLRCIYCHNPDSWSLCENKIMSVNEIINIVIKYKNYYKVSGGGVTISGGEALLQNEFLLKLLKALKKHRINVALDTCGYGKGNYKEILKYVDYLLLDIKGVNKRDFYKFTQNHHENVLDFINASKKADIEILIRHVIIPGINDNKKYIKRFKNYIDKTFFKVSNVTFLPFHKLCIDKYNEMNMDFSLKNNEDMNKDKLLLLSNYYNSL